MQRKRKGEWVMPIQPKQGHVYTLRQIIKDLDLDDIPALTFDYLGYETGLQQSHVTEEELLSDEDLANSVWKYRYTTKEWVPVFSYAGKIAIEHLVSIEESI